MTLRHCKRVHIVVLVVPKRRGGFCTHLLPTHPKVLRRDVAGTHPCVVDTSVWSNRGLWWPTMSARRSNSALANRYEPAVWWG